MKENYRPSDEEVNNSISPAYEAIGFICKGLKKDVNCPDSYIAGMLRAIAEDFDPPER